MLLLIFLERTFAKPLATHTNTNNHLHVIRVEVGVLIIVHLLQFVLMSYTTVTVNLHFKISH